MRAPIRLIVPALTSLALLGCSSSDPLTSQGLASSSVTSEKLASKSVTNDKLADEAVDGRTIKASSITSAAIADGTISPSDLADSSVTSASIADGSVGTAEIAAKAVTTGTLDDKAVTTAKLNDGAVTAGKLDPNAAVMKLNGFAGNVAIQAGTSVQITSSGNAISIGVKNDVNAATLGGNDAATFARRDTHVITVAKQGGDFSSITSALNSINDAGQNDANGNPITYLVKVGPGTYNERVAMKSYVDIEGSGTGITTVTAPAQDDPAKGTVVGASNAQLRKLTVKSLGPGSGYATAFAAAAGQQASLRSVQLVSEAAGAFNGYGIYARGSGAVVDGRDVGVTVSGGTPYNYGFFAEISASIICRECAVSVPSTANSVALQNAGGAPVFVANSQVIGSTNGATCVNVYDQSFGARTCN
jgi:hypothetical protein